MSFEQVLAGVVAELKLDLSETTFRLLVDHYTLLERWNQKINLTAVQDPHEVAVRHYGESLFLHQHLPALESVADIGSGAGFPGIPVGIVRPAAQVFLIESVSKKVAFLSEASRLLANVSVVPKRLSEWGGSADWAVMRAVAPADVLGDLAKRVKQIAILGTSKPPESLDVPVCYQLQDVLSPTERYQPPVAHFKWQSVAELPWGEKRRIWIGST